MKKSLLAALILSIIALTKNTTLAQCHDGITPTGQPCGGTVQTAVPFLRINPDARSGAMGDVGIAISPDANALHFNASKLAMAKQNFGASLTYTPWLRNLGVNDIYLAYGTGYYQFGGKVKQAVGLGIRYFSLGSINWTDINGQPLGEGSPREFEIAGSYSRQLSANFAIGATGKFIYSNLATGQDAGGGTPITSGKAGAFDISGTYKKKMKMSGGTSELTIGGAITNFGSKITYLRAADFLPTNLGLGAAWDVPLDQYNSIVIAVDMNKLLVPTPRPGDSTDTNGDKIPDWRQKSLAKGVFGSFTDAPGGAGEEFKEINWSIGLEYWYDRQFAVRAGYFREDKTKGGRQYFTVGLGLKYNVMGINLSYLVPTSSQRGPLDNTLRFSLLFDAASFKDTDDN
jgi:Type IX secretion system protein PorV